ncbi:MAG: tetratricopeptide repeat protein [Terracidiphilus sp.]
MRTQSLPSLAMFLAIVSLPVTPALLSAQEMGALSSRTSDHSLASSSGETGTAPILSSPKVKDDAATLAAVGAKSVSLTAQNEFAVEAFTGILDQYRRMGNREAEAETLCALANSYDALHQQQKAVEDYQLALAIWRELGNKDGEAATLAHIGDVYRAWGFAPQAIRFYHDALKVYPATHKKAEEAAVLNNLGLSFFLTGDKKKCVSYLDQALAAYHATQDRQGEAFTLTNLGSAYGFLLNNPYKSLDYFQEAVTRLELLNDRESEANALDIMGELWLKLAKPEMAEISFQHALILFSRTGNSQGEASARKHLSALGQTEIIASDH